MPSEEKEVHFEVVKYKRKTIGDSKGSVHDNLTVLSITIHPSGWYRMEGLDSKNKYILNLIRRGNYVDHFSRRGASVMM